MADDTQLNIRLQAIDDLTPTMKLAVEQLQKIADAVTKATPAIKDNAEAHGELNTGLVNVAAGLGVLSEGWELAKGIYESVEGALERAVDEASEAQKAQNLLTGALVSTGQYSTEAAESVNEYAEEVFKASGANQEMVKSHVALGVQMGLTVDKSEEMEEAARKLASLTGGDVNQAFSLLQQTLAGHSRGLARILPQVKELTAGQLQEGDAIGIVNEALTAQYELYQGSYAASLDRAKNSLSEVYKEIGNIIINSPIVKEAMSAFADTMVAVANAVKTAGQYLNEHSAQIAAFASSAERAALIVGGLVAAIVLGNTVIPIAAAVFGALATSVELYGVAGTIAANATALLDGALAILLSPITLVIAGVVALTAAFYKWPGLFDVLVGSIKAFIGIAIAPMMAALGGLTIGMGKIIEIFNKDWGASIANAGTAMVQFNADLVTGGIAQAKYGATHLDGAKAANVNTEAVKANAEAQLESVSAANAAAQAQEKLYGEYEIGTLKSRTHYTALLQDQNTALKEFQDYYNARVQVAKSGAEKEAIEEANSAQYKANLLKGVGGNTANNAEADAEIKAEQVKRDQYKKMYDEELIDKKQFDDAMLASTNKQAQVMLQANLKAQQDQAALLKGTGGESEATAQAKVAIDAENLKQAQLKEAYARQLISKQQFDAAMLASEQRTDAESLKATQAHEAQIAALLGKSEQGFQAREKLKEAQVKKKQQQDLQTAKQAGATQAQLDTMAEQQTKENLAMRNNDSAAYYSEQAQMEKDAGNQFQSFLDTMKAAQIREGTVLGTLHAVQSSEYYKTEMGMLTNVASLRSSHSKTAFEAGKKAAIAQATVQTFLSATEAFAAMASIPIVGPILGAVAAAAAVAAGFVQIQNINSQQFSQAHGGLDSVPAGMDNSTFLLSGGERVVQPEANKDLTSFLGDQKDSSGGGSNSGGDNYNIELNYTAGGASSSQTDAKQMAQMVVKEIRRMSERGTPIMNAKGITS